jgi:hypothetical protein
MSKYNKSTDTSIGKRPRDSPTGKRPRESEGREGLPSEQPTALKYVAVSRTVQELRRMANRRFISLRAALEMVFAEVARRLAESDSRIYVDQHTLSLNLWNTCRDSSIRDFFVIDRNQLLWLPKESPMSSPLWVVNVARKLNVFISKTEPINEEEVEQLTQEITALLVEAEV